MHRPGATGGVTTGRVRFASGIAPSILAVFPLRHFIGTGHVFVDESSFQFALKGYECSAASRPVYCIGLRKRRVFACEIAEFHELSLSCAALRCQQTGHNMLVKSSRKIYLVRHACSLLTEDEEQKIP